jgi:hypothetical protein
MLKVVGKLPGILGNRISGTEAAVVSLVVTYGAVVICEGDEISVKAFAADPHVVWYSGHCLVLYWREDEEPMVLFFDSNSTELVKVA